MTDRLHAQQFAEALLFSLQSDAGYRAAARDRNAVFRSDFGAVSLVQAVLLSPGELPAFCENTARFADLVRNRPEEHRVLRSFVIIPCDGEDRARSNTPGGSETANNAGSDASGRTGIGADGDANASGGSGTEAEAEAGTDVKALYLSALQPLVRECRQKGLVADFVLADPEHCTASPVGGRRITDRKLAAALREMTAAGGKPDYGERLKEKKRSAAAHRIQAERVYEVRPVNPIAFLILINAILYFFDLYFAVRYGYKPLQAMGIQDNALIRQGEIWRLFTPMFLHADFAHLAGNMLSLVYLGSIALQFYTVREFFAIYLFSGFVGNLLSFFLTDYLSLGASGAIMGLGGMLIYRMFFGKYAKSFRLAGNYAVFAVMVIFNLFYGVFAVNSNINNFGHFGGFAGGFLMAAVIAAARRRAKTKKNGTRP